MPRHSKPHMATLMPKQDEVFSLTYHSVLRASKDISLRGSAVGRAKIGIEDFDMMGIIGEGSYGKVFCAKDKLNSKKYAIKVLDKYHIMKN
eukprot:CAMPEP_0170551668 /NCGR_PEP_ID=MMETSP0211-20121228/9677_1 /TAXON_ID=311385 /ORGANISM="Pseudokeronopsis sp., Strain OXSARD2" /LENGTH=90 /DNA_ID=CAMNT_0010858991 /DNA_START=114 /DNA_END=386 /DNA_ORIENTATION=-